MNPENIIKFETTSDNDNNIRKELLLLCINDNVIIYANSYIGERSIIGENTIIYANVSIYDNSKIGQNCNIQSGAIIGSEGFGIISVYDK